MHITETPYIVDENEDFAVLYKPPCMHSAPLKGRDSLAEWYGSLNPRIFDLNGRKTGEGGLMHRLDFHTRGLVLFAKNQKTFDALACAQTQGRFIKSYRALCRAAPPSKPGFPAPVNTGAQIKSIDSYFRAYGPGRKEVRPVLDPERTFRGIAADSGAMYRTQVLSVDELPPNNSDAESSALYSIDIRISRGFRHQIRCHLAWVCYPILNDALYGPSAPVAGHLALCSCGLAFPGPDSKPREYRIQCRELELRPDSG